MRDYRKYEVWERAHELTVYVYKELIPGFPKSEQFNLTSQLIRACCSITFNIVEGCGRHTEKDFTHFLDIALGSAHETEYCLLLSFNVGYISEDKFRTVNEKVNMVKAKLINLIKKVRSS